MKFVMQNQICAGAQQLTMWPSLLQPLAIWSSPKVPCWLHQYCCGTPSGLLLFSCGLYLRSCFWGRWSGIHSNWPSCRSLISFASVACSSTGSSPAPFRMSMFWCMSHKVSLWMSQRHLIWKVFSSLTSRYVTGQISTLYRVTAITIVQKCLQFGCLPKLPAPEDFPPPHFVHFANLLKPHYYHLLLYLCPNSLSR